MKFERKITIAPKTTDILKDVLGKAIKVKTDYTSLKNIKLISREGEAKKAEIQNDQSLTAAQKAEAIEANNDAINHKTMVQLIGKETWEEVKEFLERSENYNQNFYVFNCEIMAIANGISYEEMDRRFQHATARQ